MMYGDVSLSVMHCICVKTCKGSKEDYCHHELRCRISLRFPVPDFRTSNDSEHLDISTSAVINITCTICMIYTTMLNFRNKIKVVAKQEKIRVVILTIDFCPDDAIVSFEHTIIHTPEKSKTAGEDARL